MTLQQLSLVLKNVWDIEGAEDWDFAGSRSQDLTHPLHPYLASMVPPIPRRLLKLYGKQGDRILDPFVGGGTVSTEAYIANIHCAGVDVNPLAIIIAKAKVTPIPETILRFVAQNIDESFYEVQVEIPEFSKLSNVEYWFKEYMFEPLAKLRTAIQHISLQVEQDYRDSVNNLLRCVYSHTIRGVSLTYRSEIRLRRLEQEDYIAFNPNVYSEFKTRMRDSFNRVSQLPFHDVDTVLTVGDAKNLIFDAKTFDLAITSPPYGDLRNTVPYHQFSKNMLYWLGYDDKDIAQVRQQSLGAKSEDCVLPPSRILEAAVNQMTKASSIEDATYFYGDYRKALAEISRVVKRRVIIVIGHRVLNHILIDNAEITTEFMEQFGWRLEKTFERRIPGKRLHKKMAFGNNSQGATIDRESILIYTPN